MSAAETQESSATEPVRMRTRSKPGPKPFLYDGKTLAEIGISRRQAAEFVLMAENPVIVDEVIARSTNADPPTRRKVLRAIADAKRARAGIPARFPPDRRHVIEERQPDGTWRRVGVLQ